MFPETIEVEFKLEQGAATQQPAQVTRLEATVDADGVDSASVGPQLDVTTQNEPLGFITWTWVAERKIGWLDDRRPRWNANDSWPTLNTAVATNVAIKTRFNDMAESLRYEEKLLSTSHIIRRRGRSKEHENSRETRISDVPASSRNSLIKP